MIKLYKRHADGSIDYREAWVDGDEIIEHWGRIGGRGASRRHRRDPNREGHADVGRVLSSASADGYVTLPLDEHRQLIVECKLSGWGSGQDLAKRHAVEDRLNETLGWTGLGHVDGGSIGSGTMEVCCLVVDFDVARRAIADDLAATEFGDYSQIYDDGPVKGGEV